jgi:biotin--protein ligase
MVGDPVMEVVGDRELAFYPDTCRGLAFDGFKYQSEEGTRAAEIGVRREAFEGVDGVGDVPESFHGYCNGGGVFVNGEKYRSGGVEVLASYTENLDVDSGEGAAAVVYCKVGDGAALLTGIHPEYVYPAHTLFNLMKDLLLRELRYQVRRRQPRQAQ